MTVEIKQVVICGSQFQSQKYNTQMRSMDLHALNQLQSFDQSKGHGDVPATQMWTNFTVGPLKI